MVSHSSQIGQSHPALPLGATAQLMVGMEIHVELATLSKMWTSAPNLAHPDNFDAEPNTLLSPVVVGMPGTLPVMNKRALEMSILVGLALNCEIAKYSKWDRKGYYYPDLPKNYQLSQYDIPICGEGWMDIPASQEGGESSEGKRIRIIRAHLEEDAGKLLHEGPGGTPIDYSIVDLNRAGTPLLEIVTHPDFTSADDAVTFGQMLRDLCRALGVTEGIMQKGHMRFEPNINVIINHQGTEYRTPIAEIKNLNSFKALHGSINYEYERQIEAWAETGAVMGKRMKVTRGWNDAKEETFHQRHNEDEDEYRYFPDPDLVPVVLTDEQIDALRNQLPELPGAKRARYIEQLKLDAKDATQLLDEPATAALFDDVVNAGADAVKAAKLLLNAAAKHANEKGCAVYELGVSAEQYKDILSLVSEGKISSNGADELIGHCAAAGGVDSSTLQTPQASALDLAEQHDLIQKSDTGELQAFIDQILADPKNEKAIADIQEGKDKAVGALMGQIMKLTQGKANPALVRPMILKSVRG